MWCSCLALQPFKPHDAALLRSSLTCLPAGPLRPPVDVEDVKDKVDVEGGAGEVSVFLDAFTPAVLCFGGRGTLNCVGYST